MRKADKKWFEEMIEDKGLVKEILYWDRFHKAHQAERYELAKDLQKKGTIIVASKEAFNNLKPLIQKKSGEGFEITSLEVAVDEKKGITCTPSTVVQPAGRLNKYVEHLVAPLDIASYVQKETFKVGNEEVTMGKPEHHRRFFRGLVSIEVKDAAALELLNDRPIGRINRMDAATGRVFETWILDLGIEDKYLNLISGEVQPKSHGVCNFDGSWKEDILWYNTDLGYDTTTPGQIKHKEITSPAANLPGFDMAVVMTELTYGGIDRVQHLIDMGLIDEENASLKMVAQLSTRWAQWRAAQADVATVNTLVLYGGKVKGSIGMDGKPYEYADGEGYTTSTFFADACNDALMNDQGLVLPNGAPKYYILPDAVVEEHYQGRHWMAKEKKRVIDDLYLQRGMDRLIGGDKSRICYIYREDGVAKNAVKQYLLDTLIHKVDWQAGLDKLRGELTDEAAIKEWESLAALPAGAQNPYKDKLIVICPNDEYTIDDAECFSDLNGMKTTFDVTKDSCINMMLMGHSDGEAHTSGQLAATLMSADTNWSLDFFDRQGFQAAETTTRKFLNADGHAPSYEDFTRPTGINCSDILQTVMPRFIRDYYQPEYRRGVETKLNGIVNDTARLRTGIEGEHEYASPDPAVFLTGKQILKATKKKVECLCKDLGEDVDALAIKYPKMGDHEYMIVHAIGWKEVVLRAVAHGMKPVDIYLLYLTATHLSSGAMNVAACQILAFLLAGYDNDGDHFMLIKNAEIVTKLLEVFYFQATVISEDDKTEIAPEYTEEENKQMIKVLRDLYAHRGSK